ncbi:MAG: gliding motility-associated C-terminal domain-containing protein [Bacteroidetes bacterium]|nr:gliding motility-associated C-terminal domain-containing protein [Bacteroidota bacterium]
MKQILSILLLIPLLAFAQKQANIWYFGDYAGLDFNTGSPVALANSQMYTQEGCSSICDQNGDILFYTNGIKVWNKNHALMENGIGLLGHQSATQSSLVIPNPSNNGLFYIFTVDAIENSLVKGFNYSVVDINQNGGLGKVISINNLLFSPNCEKICAVRQDNGTGFWVVTHKWNSNTFYIYPVTTEGVGDPIISNVGLSHEGNIRNAIGQMKFSPSGDRIALVLEISKKIEILDFDKATGQISNSINFTCPYNYKTYGVEFSPDGTKLYVSSWNPDDSIIQFSLESGTASGILGSAVEIFYGGNIQRAALQIGPDEKIYVARRFQQYVGVINQPNEDGLSCNYVDQGVSLNGKSCLFGLPNYISGVYSPWEIQDFLFDAQCSGDTTFFYLQNTNTLTAVEWDFGDPSSANNTSTLFNPYHIYASPGSYTVKLISYFASNNDTVIKEILINPSPEIDLGPDTVICSNEGYLLEAGEGYTSYLWQDGSANSTYNVETSGLFWVEVMNEFGCVAYDSVSVEILPKPDISLGNDTLICSGDSLVLNVGVGYNDYLWSTGQTNPEITIDTAGIYWVSVTNEFGCSAIDTILVQIYPIAFEKLELGPDTSFCEGTPLILNAGAGYTFYQWMNQPGTNDSLFVVDTAGTYFVYVSNPCSEGWDTINVSMMEVEEVDLGNDTTLCDGDFILLDAGFGYTDYLWQDGSSNASYYAGTTGWYWVEATDENGCIAADSIQLNFVAPDPDIGPDTSFCEGDSVSFVASEFVSYLWQDGSSLPWFTCDQAMLVWCQVTDTMGCVGTDSAFAQVLAVPSLSLGSDVEICPGDTAIIASNIDDPGIFMVWQNGSEDSIFVTSEPGIFWLQATNLCGSVTDSIEVTQLALPEVFLGNDTILSSNSAITLDPGGGFASYFWSDGSEQPWITVEQAGAYWVEVSDGKCFNADTIVIEPIDCELFVPIVFSPNSDQHNDTFYADVSDDIYDFNLTVFNRWGEKVWETSDKTGQWDGNRNGHPSASSVYYWMVTFKCYGSPKTFERRGSVTLLR